jgi:hypothetical protein
MALGALIGAYQEDDNGGLRALLPLAGRTLLEYQVRCAFAAAAAPIVVVVERMPQALQDAIERLRLDGISVIAISAIEEAISRFEAGSMVLVIGDGVVPAVDLVSSLAEEPEPAVATVPDDEAHEQFERIDAESRWAGVALVDSRLLGSTAAMLGDWDLQSTLLRRTIQEGARRMPLENETGEPLLVDKAEQLQNFEQRLIASSRGPRTDWVSRFLLPPIEEVATRQLLDTAVKPAWLLLAAVGLTLAGAICFARGWLGAGLVLLVLSTPLDLIASRLAIVRMRPLPARNLARQALWPAAGIALLALGWWETGHGTGWGSLVCAVATLAFAEAARIEKDSVAVRSEPWLFSRRSAIFAAIPFALAGTWTAYLVAMLGYAALSFFGIQRVRHTRAS